jgi:hypothetical protein
MRVFIAISIVVASVSSASAQSSFAMDHGSAAAAAQAARAAQAAATPAAAIAFRRAVSSQQTNFYVNSGGIVKTCPGREA